MPSSPPPYPKRRSQPALTRLTSLPPSYIHATPLPHSPSMLSPPPSSPPTFHSHRNHHNNNTTNFPLPSAHSTPSLRPRITNNDGNAWLRHTAATLAARGLEEKGRTWLATRESSTSLQMVGDGEGRDDNNDDVVIQEADFLNVEEEGEGVDEGEMRRVVMGRVGGWVDWAVGWMDLRGDGEGEGEGEEGGDGEEVQSKFIAGMREIRTKDEDNEDREEMVEEEKEGRLPIAPGNEVGILGDAKWLMGVVGRVVL